MTRKRLDCGHFPHPNDLPYDHFTDTAGKTCCLPCWAERDRARLRFLQPGEWTRMCFDVTSPEPESSLPNQRQYWVTSTQYLVIPVNRYRLTWNHKGSEPEVTRLDVWFTFEGRKFWGFNSGPESDELNIKRLKN